MKFRSRHTRLMDFQQAAMTDVIFQLIIFFLLTSTFVAQSAIKLSLPSTVTKVTANPSKIIVTVGGDSRLYLNETLMSNNDELKAALSSLLENQDDKKVVIKADQNLPLQAVVSAMDIAKQAGALELALATKSDLKAALSIKR